ncbi:hypothetical protein [[Mycoplasma] collis]|uniref:hypothetical protein n=1 Tax=[Mycoplasma] collis TaxID=2127 RepID=UPI00051C389D|nr:hypothetical protein [[Mycoplasma] collis]
MLKKYIHIADIAAKKAKNIYKTIPLEYEDLFVTGLNFLNETLKNNQDKIPNDDPNAWLYKSTYIRLLNYCKKFTTNNHKIMNFKLNYVDEINKFSKDQHKVKNYSYYDFFEIENKEFFQNFSNEKFQILWMYFIDKIPVKKISEKFFISSNKINDIIKFYKQRAFEYINGLSIAV